MQCGWPMHKFCYKKSDMVRGSQDCSCSVPSTLHAVHSAIAGLPRGLQQQVHPLRQGVPVPE